DSLSISKKSLIENFLRVLLVLNFKRCEGSRLHSSTDLLLDSEDDQVGDFVTPVPHNVNWTPQAKLLASGQSHSAAVVGEQLYSWGLDENGRLGLGNTQPNTSASPQCIHSLPYRVVAVSCGKHHTVALTDHGVFSWGSSQFGQLGHGNHLTCTRPMLVSALQGELCVSITCGQYHSLALSADNRVYSWGWGVHGQLGSGSIEDRLTPMAISALDDYGVTIIAAGYCHSGVVDRDGRVWLFGNGSFGQLGRAVSKATSPIELISLSRERVKLLASGRFHMVAITKTGKVCTWGSDPQTLRQVMHVSRRHHRAKGKAGPCVMDTSYNFPRLVESPDGVDFQQLECGQNHCLMVTSSGQL
ncbi:ultraviolet-B receptor UVR8-like, partial [Anneissia japonica]|uniref:ultraviolet-B receptor UVR8-like n=1 Tax=Anneissia japonica TaxID=1529436 RepID=UPI0014256D69